MQAQRSPHRHAPKSRLEGSSNQFSTIGSTVTSRSGARVLAEGNRDAMR